jgi:uncharacterized Rossmann fold enzyme
MDSKDWAEIYNEMRSVFERDKELTHIQVVFHIKPVVSEKKVAKIDIKTFRDENRINR